MRAFSFRLERLRTLAEGERRARAQDLAAAQAQAETARGDVARQEAARRAHLEEARTPADPVRLDLDQWSAGQANYQVLRDRQVQAEYRLAAASQEVEEARGAYLEARRSGRTLERVRARRKAVWDGEAQRVEQAAIDEQNTRRGGAG